VEGVKKKFAGYESNVSLNGSAFGLAPETGVEGKKM
jgi:hypothetical protein